MRRDLVISVHNIQRMKTEVKQNTKIMIHAHTRTLFASGNTLTAQFMSESYKEQHHRSVFTVFMLCALRNTQRGQKKTMYCIFLFFQIESAVTAAIQRTINKLTQRLRYIYILYAYKKIV